MNNFFNLFGAGKDKNMNYYQLLGISEKAKPGEINKVYCERMRAYHPDKNPHGKAMTRLFTKAKETLMDPHKKAVYDQQMYIYATGVHHQQGQPMDFAVVDPVFPKFGDVLKMNKCEELALMMEQLTEKAAAAHGNNLNNMMDAFIKAVDLKFICNKCKKQLVLNDICYCKDAKTKCHCNSRVCCTVTLKERGKFT
uniref:J domain-containing protein n=1 Tax=Globodera rostochiensis TaxID=31243 RepID=A0A914HF06_GLORO